MAAFRRMIGLSALAALALPAAAAIADTAGAQVGCGATITHSTTLTHDVGPCPGNGLVVTADNLTLNLAGHRVFGTSAQGASVGILVRDVRGVTVTGGGSVDEKVRGAEVKGGGSVDSFDAGVAIVHGGANTIRGLGLHDNSSNQFTADHPELAQFGDGLVILGSSANRVTGNVMRENGPYSGISVVTETDQDSGVSGPTPRKNVLSHNVVRDNNVPDVCMSNGTFFGGPCHLGDAVFSEDIGIRVEGPGATGTRIWANRVTGNGRDGISVLDTFNGQSPPGVDVPSNNDTHILGNDSSGNGRAVVITDPQVGQLGGDGIFNRCFTGSVLRGCPSETVIRGNRTNHNPAHGIALDHSQGNTVIGNSAFGNGFGTVTVYASDPPYTDGFDTNTNPACDHNVWRNNALGSVNELCVRGHGAGAASTAPAPMSAPFQRGPARSPASGHRARAGL